MSLYKELDNFIGGISSEVHVEKACYVDKIHSQYLVDVYYYNNNKKELLYDVPVKHLQTKGAFVYLGLKVGDKGTIKFFDNDVDGYKTGSEILSTEIRTHDINDNYFDYGFYPDKEHYIMPDRPLCIGLSNLTALIEFTEDGKLLITSDGLTVAGNSAFTDTLTANRVIARNGVSKDIVDSLGKVLATVKDGIVES